MIHELEIENYKAFNSARIEIRPITILLGANSTGKTSIIQTPLLFKQSSLFRNMDLRLNGEEISLGEPENLFHKFDTKKKLSFSWKVDLEYDVLSELYESLTDTLQRLLERATRFLGVLYLEDQGAQSQEYIRSFRSARDSFSLQNSDDHDLVTELKAIRLKINKKLKTKNRKTSRRIRRELSLLKEFLQEKVNFQEALRTLDYLMTVSQLEIRTYTYKVGYSINKSNGELLVVSEEIIDSDDKFILGYDTNLEKRGRTAKEFYSDYEKSNLFDLHRSQINSRFTKTDTRKSRLSSTNWASSTQNIVSKTVNSIFNEFRGQLRFHFLHLGVNSVGPLRAAPKRYYFLGNSGQGVSNFRSDNGDYLSLLLKQNKKLRSKVNSWLDKFDLQIDISKLKDIIHNLKVSQNGINLDITDVGFGISQVLPVIVQGFLAREESLTIIEQPEIHLHPKMQAELADLFISMSSTSQGNFLIETHSEYLLRRLRRRMAEGEISPEEVGIYFIEKGENCSMLREVQIDEGGAFDFPKDFYEDELADTIAFMSNYKKRVNA